MNYAAALSLLNDDNKSERNAAVFRLMEFSVVGERVVFIC